MNDRRGVSPLEVDSNSPAWSAVAAEGPEAEFDTLRVAAAIDR